MRIKATFTGTNGSLGYETGKVYELFIQTPKHYSQTDTVMIFGKQKDGIDLSPLYYSTVIAFLRNWNHIEVIE